MMAEQQLLTAMQAHPGASLSVLGSVVGASRGAIASKLHKLARRGTVAKSRDGHWRLADWEAGGEARPTLASPN
jgi:DNA-binding IclR family transcriptional regulator